MEGSQEFLEWDLVDINVPDPLLCPLLWLLCYCVSITYKLTGVSCSPGNSSASPVCLTPASLSSCTRATHLFKVTFSPSKLTTSWEFARWKVKRKTVKSIKFELDFGKQIFGSLKIYPGHQITQTGIKYLLGSTWPYGDYLTKHRFLLNIALRYFLDNGMVDTKLGHPFGVRLQDLLTALACVHKVKPQLKSQEGSDSG